MADENNKCEDIATIEKFLEVSEVDGLAEVDTFDKNDQLLFLAIKYKTLVDEKKEDEALYYKKLYEDRKKQE